MSNPATDFVGSCVEFVQFVIGAGSAQAGHLPLGNANTDLTSLSAGGWQRVKSSAVQIGDVAVWQPNTHGTGSVGHVALVAAPAASNGDVTVIQSNWGTPNRPSIMTVPYASDLSFFRAPTAAEQLTNAQATGAAAQGLPTQRTSGGATGVVSTGGSSGVTAQSTGQGSPCQSLTEIMSSGVDNVPLLGGLWKGVSAPVKLVGWLAQPCVLWRIAFILGALVLVFFGAHLLFRQEMLIATATAGISKASYQLGTMGEKPKP